MNIIIDTSVFLRQNFISGNLIKRLGELSHEKIVNIYVTDIIKKELFSNIDKDSLKLKSKLTDINKSIRGDLKFVKNLYKDLDFFDYINPERLNHLLKNKIERYFKYANIQIIPISESFKITDILDDYFNQKPPFSEKKKNEFPDAISFKVSENFFQNKNDKAYFITYDNDFNEIKSKFIFVKNNLEDIIEEISKENSSLIYEQNELIEKTIKSNIQLFKDILEPELDFELSFKIQHIFEKENIFPDVSTSELKYTISETKVFDVNDSSQNIGFKFIGSYNGKLDVYPEKEFNPLKYKEILKNNGLKLNSNFEITVKGEFQMSFFYEYEFPYKIEEDTISFDEDEYKLKNIENN